MVSKVWIKSHRNLDEILLHINPLKSVFIYGDNNQGKTNFLEALYCVANGRSPYESLAPNMIRFDEHYESLGMEITSSTGPSLRVYVRMFRDGRKNILFNDQEIKSFRCIKDTIHIDYISADIVRLFQGYPESRRRFLDRFLSLADSSYSRLLKQYNQLIKQKNNLLKTGADISNLDLWNEQIVDLSCQIVQNRLSGILRLQSQCMIYAHQIDLLKSYQFDIHYTSASYSGDWTDIECYRDALKTRLFDNKEKEYRAGKVLYGPHRDDFVITLDGVDMFRFFSKGVNRIVAILIFLSQVRDVNRDSFVLLMDDAMAEVNHVNKQALMMIIEGLAQVFYVSTDRSDYSIFNKSSPMVFNMSEGQLTDG